MKAEEYYKMATRNAGEEKYACRDEVITLMQDYAKLKCEEQRNICYEQYETEELTLDPQKQTDMDIVIINAPEPIID